VIVAILHVNFCFGHFLGKVFYNTGDGLEKSHIVLQRVAGWSKNMNFALYNMWMAPLHFLFRHNLSKLVQRLVGIYFQLSIKVQLTARKNLGLWIQSCVVLNILNSFFVIHKRLMLINSPIHIITHGANKWIHAADRHHVKIYRLCEEWIIIT